MSVHWILFVAVPVSLLALFVVVTYNKLVARRLRIHESWSNVDTELKRRHDLVPNLVTTVQAYAAHERGLFEAVTSLRTQARRDNDDSERRRDAERRLAGELRRLLAVAEGYPELKASRSFLQLQEELAETENRIQAARRFYNGNVRDYNNTVLQFPTNLVARVFGHDKHTYFELPNVAERSAPRARFGPADGGG